MGVQENAYPLRIDKGSMDKLRVIAKKHSRSVNKEIEYLVNCHIETYEKEYGEIVVPKE